MKAIEASNLTKLYGSVLAVDGITFNVEEGEIFGFLGPNGAGKTTTIKMLNTLSRISSGSASVGGYDVSKHPAEVRKVIGVVPQEMTLDREMTGRENLRIQGKLYGISSEPLSKRIGELLSLVDMHKAAGREVNTYSWGMQKRLELIMGLVHDPKVVFLDEPTLGLDAQTRSSIWEYVRRLNREHNVTIFLTTHYLEEADQLCGRIAIIDGGRLKAVGTPTELKNSIRGEVVTLRLRQPAEGLGLEQLLRGVAGVMKVEVNGSLCEVETAASGSVTPKLVLALAVKGIEVETLSVQKTDLNQVFLRHTSTESEASAEEDQVKLLAKERLLRRR